MNIKKKVYEVCVFKYKIHSTFTEISSIQIYNQREKFTSFFISQTTNSILKINGLNSLVSNNISINNYRFKSK